MTANGAPDPILRNVPETIHTDRLTLRPPRPGDGERIFKAVCESIAELRRFPASLPWAVAEPSPADSEKYCREAYSRFVARRDLPLLVFLRDSNVLVASSGLHDIEWSVPKFEVGFWGHSAHHGKGYVTEAVSAILDMAFDVLGARRVQALPDEANERSCRVCERVGLTLEGTLRNDRVGPDGTLRNTRVYAKVQ